MNANSVSAFTTQSASGGGEIFSLFSSAYARERRVVMGLTDYLEGCATDPSMYASAAERMIAAIGEPQVIDTSKDQRLGRIFLNRTIKIYPTMTGFFGMEDTIQRVVSYFQHAAQGLEERKQVLYLLGPVGGGKSSLAERLKHLMESSRSTCSRRARSSARSSNRRWGCSDPIRWAPSSSANTTSPLGG